MKPKIEELQFFSKIRNIDSKNHICYLDDDTKVHLTKKETLFLELLKRGNGDFVSKNDIEFHIWNNDSTNRDCSGRLKTLVYELRKKIGKESIVTCYALGYKIREELR